jgi:DNA-binding NarL/FixJ family response regulator
MPYNFAADDELLSLADLTSMLPSEDQRKLLMLPPRARTQHDTAVSSITRAIDHGKTQGPTIRHLPLTHTDSSTTPSSFENRVPMLVLSVDDHPLIRSALRDELLQLVPEVTLLEAPNPPEAIDLLRQHPNTELVFLEIAYAAYDGLRYLRTIRDLAPAAPLIVYTMHEDPLVLRRALDLGATGVVPKTHNANLLLRAIELVMQGGIYLPPALARSLASLPATLRSPHSALTTSELNVLRLLADGSPNKVIATRLGIAISTVKKHTQSLFQKINVRNRTEAALAAHYLLRGLFNAKE